MKKTSPLLIIEIDCIKFLYSHPNSITSEIREGPGECPRLDSANLQSLKYRGLAESKPAHRAGSKVWNQHEWKLTAAGKKYYHSITEEPGVKKTTKPKPHGLKDLDAGLTIDALRKTVEQNDKSLVHAGDTIRKLNEEIIRLHKNNVAAQVAIASDVVTITENAKIMKEAHDEIERLEKANERLLAMYVDATQTIIILVKGQTQNEKGVKQP